jgi:glucose-1-phosphate adenylyltransferase
VTIRNSVVMGADFYENGGEPVAAGTPRIGIGAGSRIQGAIIDKNCRIGVGSQVVNRDETLEGEIGDICSIRDGILVVEKDAVLPEGWQT